MSALVETPRQPLVPAGAETGQFLTFMLSGETFALGILRIKEIIEFGDLTKVPMMPPFIRGVINLRGRVVPVVDLSARFGRGESRIARRTCIVIVEAGGEGNADRQDIGILVDAVNEVVEIAGVDIEPAPAFGAHLRPEFIQGMAKRNGRFIILLAVDQVLSISEMSHLGQMFALDQAVPAQLP
jgi:purine-binding chemotaxis protein CheW